MHSGEATQQGVRVLQAAVLYSAVLLACDVVWCCTCVLSEYETETRIEVVDIDARQQCDQMSHPSALHISSTVCVQLAKTNNRSVLKATPSHQCISLSGDQSGCVCTPTTGDRIS